MTKRLAVIGYPLGHTLSPAIHGAAIRELGLDLTYDAVELGNDFNTAFDGLTSFVDGLRQREWLGCNVTVPFKQAVRVDELSAEARAIGAVNTIENRGGRLIGHNTDARGFIEDVEEQFGDPARKTVFVLGAGGAARAVTFALANRAQRVWVWARRYERAVKLVDEITAARGGVKPGWLEAAPIFSRGELMREAELIVNCTSAGLRPDDSPIQEALLPRQANLYDLIYNPPETRLMRAVTERGGKAVNGLGMLVRQAAASFRIWTGVEPPLDVMFRAAEDALRERAHV